MLFIPVFLFMCNFPSNSEKFVSNHSPSTIHLLVYTFTVYIERSFRTVNPYLCKKHFGFQWKHHFFSFWSYHFYLPPSVSLCLKNIFKTVNWTFEEKYFFSRYCTVDNPKLIHGLVLSLYSDNEEFYHQDHKEH